MLDYCNIRFPYRIRKYFRNILINILGHKGKSNEGDELVKAIRCVPLYKGLKDWEFCEVFSLYCGHSKVL